MPTASYSCATSLLFTDGPLHLERKMIFTNLFTKEAMAYYELKLLEPTIDDVMAEVKTARGPDGLARTDMVPLMRIMLHRISARLAGVDGVNTPERTEKFRQLVKKLAEAVDAHWTTKDRQELVGEGIAAFKTLIDEYLKPSLERRRDLASRFKAGEVKKEDLPRDALMMICLQGDDTRLVDSDYDAYVWREAAFFLVAGTGTSTTTLPFAPVHIDAWIKAHPEDTDKLNDTNFLRRCVGETLRLHQTAPVRFRVAAKDVVLSTGRKVAAGEKLALMNTTANREVDLFGPDAGEFKPYREIPAGLLPWGMTFGGGAHMCCGRSLVTGLQNRSDEKTGTEGTLVKILKRLYSVGMELDPTRPPSLVATSHLQAYESVPIILRKL
jgi:cytochrome P450